MLIGLVLVSCAPCPKSEPAAAPGATATRSTRSTHPTSAIDPADPLASLAWLSGTWITTDPVGPQTVEHWMPPAGGTMLGLSRTVLDGRTVFFEFLRIEHDATSDTVVYLASPLGRDPPTRFARVEHGPSSIAFANPDHDFPQRIEYTRQGSQLTARISGEQDGQPKASSWSLERAPGP